MKEKDASLFIGFSVTLVLMVLTYFFFTILSSCTYNISMVHTEGEADDVIDTTQAADPNISPNINVTPTGI